MLVAGEVAAGKLFSITDANDVEVTAEPTTRITAKIQNCDLNNNIPYAPVTFHASAGHQLRQAFVKQQSKPYRANVMPTNIIVVNQAIGAGDAVRRRQRVKNA